MVPILFTTLFLSPYILVPLFMARTFKRRAIHPQWLTYLLTAIILLIYPELFFRIAFLFKEPLKEGQYLCMFPPILINIVLLPIALVIQWIFNRRNAYIAIDLEA
jgi:cell shape-determining protein MreD